MVSYDFLTKKDRLALVHYVRCLAQFEEPAERADALLALERELAAPGERVPNRIPVRMAESKLIEEYGAPRPLRLGPESSAVARWAVVDRGRAARVLAEAPDWRQSPETLARVALADMPANGFRPAVAAFTSAEWQSLLADLQRATEPTGVSPQGPARGAKR
jgi:hypothetical protein